MENRNKLIKLAAEMAMRSNMPSPFFDDWNFSKNITKKDARNVLNKAKKADEQCRDWAVRLRAIIDDTV